MKKRSKFVVKDPILRKKLKEIDKLAAKGVPPGVVRGPRTPVRFLQEMEELNDRLGEYMKGWNEMIAKEQEEKREKERIERRARRLAQKNADKEKNANK